MNLKTRRAINFWWAFGSVILVAALGIGGFYLFKDTGWYLYFVITLVLSFALFWGFFLTYTSFKKNMYPFLTFVPEYSPTDNMFKKSLTYKFIWIWLIPICAAIIVPLFFLIYHAVHIPESFDWKSILVYCLILVMMLINNLVYVFVVHKGLISDTDEGAFTMRLD
jgi:hypothetical protein